MNTLHIGLLAILTGCVGQLDTSAPGPVATQPDASITTPPTTPDAPPSVTPKQVLEQWSGCMTLTNFQSANMAQAWGNLAAGSQLCRNCHGTGGYSFVATADEPLFFATMSEHSGYLVKFFTVQGNDVMINTASFQRAGVMLPSHPRFDPENNAGIIALKKFYDTTKARKTANTCDASRLKD